jgi:hypothetical protein
VPISTLSFLIGFPSVGHSSTHGSERSRSKRCQPGVGGACELLERPFHFVSFSHFLSPLILLFSGWIIYRHRLSVNGRISGRAIVAVSLDHDFVHEASRTSVITSLLLRPTCVLSPPYPSPFFITPSRSDLSVPCRQLATLLQEMHINSRVR